jgi:hypothetical protein
VNPADELRTAAQKIRDLTKAIHAPDLPDQSWHTEECADDEQGNCPCIVAQGVCNTDDGFVQPLYYVADAETPECAAYIAALHPGVGAALADWLEASADYASVSVGHPTHVVRAFAVARAINGTGGEQP